jgi:hypothetical protein
MEHTGILVGADDDVLAVILRPTYADFSVSAVRAKNGGRQQGSQIQLREEGSGVKRESQDSKNLIFEMSLTTPDPNSLKERESSMDIIALLHLQLRTHTM